MKYNSIGEQLIAKAQELDSNYKPDKFNDMSEAIDVILNKTGSEGGDVWLDITPYLSEDMSSISQEGFDLVSNAFFPAEETYNPINKYAGILFAGYKMFFNELVNSDKRGLNFIINANEDWAKAYIKVSIYDDKSVEIKEGIDSSWYDLDTINGKITQNQYDEIKALIDSGSLAGITAKTLLDAYFPLSNSLHGTFTFRVCGLVNESTNSDKKHTIANYEMTIKPDLSISLNLDHISTPELTQNLSSQSIISVKTDGYQENLSIGDGLIIENGALKTNNIPALPSDASTKTYVLKAVNGVLTWSE